MTINRPTLLSSDEALLKLKAQVYPDQRSYLAFYSSWLGGIVTDPAFMSIPVDDHLVHRGDGVFEALKWTSGRVYLFENHLARLKRSAERISLPLKWSDSEIQLIVESGLEQVKAKYPAVSEAIVRIYVSRGPGRFSANPYDSIGSQLYVMLTDFKAYPEEKYLKGASLGKSLLASKDKYWAAFKTCNYLPNVMVKKEAVDRKIDFVVGFDEAGFMTESSTENVILVSQRNELLKPKKDFILQGTTMNRAFELARTNLVGSLIDRVQEEDISEEMIKNAKEVMVAGTTWDILPITSFENKPIGNGSIGPVAKKLLELIRKDQASI